MSLGALNASEIPIALTIRELRRDRVAEPGRPGYLEVARKFVPLVHGLATALIPENLEAAERVSAAVFETLAFRIRRVSGKMPVATWLVRTTSYAAERERSRLGLKAKSTVSTAVLAKRLCKDINSLPSRSADAFVLCAILGEQPWEAATALKTNPRKFEKRYTKAVRKITKANHKTVKKLRDPALETAPSFRSYATAAPLEVEERILARVSKWIPKAPKDSLVSGAISSWRWLAVGRFFKRLGATVATIICLLIALAFTFKFLIDTGRVNIAKLFMAPTQRKLLKEFPGMKQPARPWPLKAEEMAFASRTGPKSAAELYGMTNIWLAKIKMSPQQWEKAQPIQIPPAPRLPNGKMALRNPKASRSGLAGAIGIDFPWSEAALEFGEYRFPRVGVRYRGNGTYLNSLYGNKQSFKIDINRANKAAQMAGVTTLNFVNCIPDFSYVKDALAEQVFRELGAVAPRTAYAYLTLDVAGKFKNQPLGLYVMVEDIGEDFAKDRFGKKKVPIFKPVTYDLFEDWGDNWSAYRDVYDLKTKATDAQLARVVEMAKLVTHASDEEFARKLPDILDLEEYAAFVAGHVLMSSYDGYLANGQNFYMYLDPESNKFGFIPWDQDHGWGEFGYVDTTDHREHANIWKPAAYNNHFLARVMKVEAFKQVYRKKLEQALSGPFTIDRLYGEVDRLAAGIRPAVAAESDFRKERFEIAISTNWVSGSRDAGKNWGDAEGPRAPAHQIKRFVENRTKSIRDQLDGKAEGVLIHGFGE